MSASKAGPNWSIQHDKHIAWTCVLVSRRSTCMLLIGAALHVLLSSTEPSSALYLCFRQSEITNCILMTFNWKIRLSRSQGLHPGQGCRTNLCWCSVAVIFPSLWAKGRYHEHHVEVSEERSLNCVRASLLQLFDISLQLERASNWGKDLSSHGHLVLHAKTWLYHFLFLFTGPSPRCLFSTVTSSKNLQTSKAY